MRTLAPQINQRYSDKRFCATVQILNEHAALHDGLFESNVRGRPYVSFNGLILTSAEQAKVAELTNSFSLIMTKAMAAIVQEPSSVLRALGWPENLEFGLRHEPLNRTLTPLGRFDFVQDTAGQWHVLEFNSDTPSGAQEITLVEKRLWSLLGRLASIARLNPNIAQVMAEALQAEALFVPQIEGITPVQGPALAPTVGLLVQGRHLTDLAQVSYYGQLLEKQGLKSIVGDISSFSLLGGQLYLHGQQIDALYRLFPIEELALEPLFAAFVQATVNGWLKALNNLRGFFAQSKAIMAWVWRNQTANIFSQAEQEIIARHLPPTYLIEDLPADFDYQSYIIKEFYGREGSEVYNGATLSSADWQKCKNWRTFVVQQRVDIAPVEHILPSADWQSKLMIEAFPCVGGFVMGGDWAGCYTRIGPRITNSYAQFIPTFKEQA